MMHLLRELFELKRHRRQRLERAWQAEVDAYRAAGGRSSDRPDLEDPFLYVPRDIDEVFWRRAFMAQFDSRTGERREVA